MPEAFRYSLPRNFKHLYQFYSAFLYWVILVIYKLPSVSYIYSKIQQVLKKYKLQENITPLSMRFITYNYCIS